MPSHQSSFEVAVAPMMAWTDRHCRYLLRLVSPSVRLFSEMITTGALLHGPRARVLAFDQREHPVALQLGGNEPQALAECAGFAEAAGYDEVNLNVGCPSARVQSGEIGACLMRRPRAVAECVRAMRDCVSVPVTVKCRLGVDADNSTAFLHDFVGTVAEAGCRTFYVHARIALLHGLTPAQNRQIPPLNHNRVLALARHFPTLRVHLNGGLETVDHVRPLVGSELAGVMIGRAAYHHPMRLAELHQTLVDPSFTRSRQWVYERYVAYVRSELNAGVPLNAMTRHVLGLFNGLPGARRYRQRLSDARALKQNDADWMLRAAEPVLGTELAQAS